MINDILPNVLNSTRITTSGLNTGLRLWETKQKNSEYKRRKRKAVKDELRASEMMDQKRSTFRQSVEKHEASMLNSSLSCTTSNLRNAKALREIQDLKNKQERASSSQFIFEENNNTVAEEIDEARRKAKSGEGEFFSLKKSTNRINGIIEAAKEGKKS